MARREKAAKPPRNQAAKKNGAAKPAIIAPGGNVTDETIREYYAKAERTKNAADKAKEEFQARQGEYRAVLKAAKNIGIPPHVLTWRLEQRARDVAEIDEETRWKNRIAALTNLPIGTQLGLFSDGKSVASAIDSSQILATPGNLADAHDAGIKAGLEGKNRDANPHEKFDPEEGPADPLAIRWDMGWKEGQKRLAQRQFGHPETEGMRA